MEVDVHSIDCPGIVGQLLGTTGLSSLESAHGEPVLARTSNTGTDVPTRDGLDWRRETGGRDSAKRARVEIFHGTSVICLCQAEGH